MVRTISFHLDSRDFHIFPDFDGVASGPTVAECDIQEYHRNLDRLDQVLMNIEKYIHVAFAVLNNEDVVQRVFDMVS